MLTDPEKARPWPSLTAASGLALALLAGCAPLPDPATHGTAALAPPPVLVPLDGILAQADAVGREEILLPSLAARADGLRSRADRMRRP